MIRELESNDGFLLQELLEKDQAFFMKVYGHDAASEATNLFYSSPNGVGLTEKCLIGLFENGGLIGCLDGVYKHPSNRDAYVGFLFVGPDARCHGRGTSILDWFSNECGCRGINNVLTSVSTINKRGLDFFLKQGFNIQTTKFDVKLDLVLSDLLILRKTLL